MKKILVSLLLIAQGIHALSDEAKNLLSGVSYPVIVMIRESKNMSDDMIKTIISGLQYRYYADYNEKLKEIDLALEAIRNLSESDLALLKQEYDELKKKREEVLKQSRQRQEQYENAKKARAWSDATKIRTTRESFKRDMQSHREKMNYQMAEARYRVQMAEAKSPAILAVISGFIDTFGTAEVVASRRDLVQKFVAQWKVNVDPEQRAKLQQIMNLIVQSHNVMNKVNGDFWALFQNEALYKEYRDINSQLDALGAPYAIALENNIFKDNNRIAQVWSYLPEILKAILEEFKKGNRAEGPGPKKVRGK